MNRKEIELAIHTWAAQYSIDADINDASTISTRTVSETATSLTTERLCTLAAYTDDWHTFCFVERVVWAPDGAGDADRIISTDFKLL